MTKTFLDPFNEKYDCCRNWWQTEPKDDSDMEEWILGRIFREFTCLTCGRHWEKDDDKLVEVKE